MATQPSSPNKNLYDALLHFAEETPVHAITLTDDGQPISVSYGPDGRMLVTGLPPELPPELDFSREHISARLRDAGWVEFGSGNEAELGLELFRLFDPRVFMNLVALWPGRILEEPPDWGSLRYQLDEVLPSFARLKEIPPAVQVKQANGERWRTVPVDTREWLRELIYVPREAAFRVVGGALLEVVHQELPPSAERFSLRYIYE